MIMRMEIAKFSTEKHFFNLKELRNITINIGRRSKFFNFLLFKTFKSENFQAYFRQMLNRYNFDLSKIIVFSEGTTIRFFSRS